MAATTLVALLASPLACGTEVVQPQIEQPTIVTLPDGSKLAVPSGATYFYRHVAVTSASTIQNLNITDNTHTEVVISRIDWSVCNPKELKVRFTNSFLTVLPQYTWRIPTLVTTPQAGINILGIFGAGNTLEGGLRMPLELPPPLNLQVVAITRVDDACDGDWVTFFGYTR